MKVTGGYLKGRKIKTIKGLDIRPTSEKIRQAFFNIIQNYIEGYVFVDLCAGTGIMSFEAVSRGFGKAILIDNSNKSIKMMNENINLLDINEECSVVFENILTFVKLKKIPENENLIIYFDPPYENKRLYDKVMHYINKIKFEKSVIFAVEHKSNLELKKIDNLEIWKVKKYGDKTISLFATFNNVC